MKTREQERDHGTADDGQRLEQLLEKAQELQRQFWDVLAELEDALGGVEILSTVDLSEHDLESLENGML